MVDSPASALRLAALNALARREHSRAELKAKLAANHPGSQVLIDDVLDRLAEQGLQSDARFAEAYCRARVNRGYGRRYIEAALRQKGVDAGCVEEAIAGADVDWCELAASVVIKRFGPESADDMRGKSRRVRFLQYRGFAGDEVRHALEVLTEDRCDG